MEFRLEHWVKPCGYVCNAGAVMFGKLDDDGKLFYKTSDGNDWREIVPKELVPDALGDKSCPNYWGSHDKIWWAMTYHYDDLVAALLNGDEKFLPSSIGYGNFIIYIKYVVGYDVFLEEGVSVADVLFKGSLQSKNRFAGDDVSVIYITDWKNRNIVKRVVDDSYKAECSIVYEF